MALATASSWVRILHHATIIATAHGRFATANIVEPVLITYQCCIGLPVLVLIVLFSQYFRKLYIPLPRGHKYAACPAETTTRHTLA